MGPERTSLCWEINICVSPGGVPVGAVHADAPFACGVPAGCVAVCPSDEQPSRSPRFQEHSVDDRALPLALEPSLTPPRSADGKSHEVILSMDDS